MDQMHFLYGYLYIYCCEYAYFISSWYLSVTRPCILKDMSEFTELTDSLLKNNRYIKKEQQTF